MNHLQDDQLWQDLGSTDIPSDVIKLLRENGVNTYGELFALLRDEKARTHRRLPAFIALDYLSQIVDKRRVVPLLLPMLKSRNNGVRRLAVNTLGQFKSRRAVKPLIELACDKTQPANLRINAIQTLFEIGDMRAISPFTSIMFDENDDLQVRSQAIEWNLQIIDNLSLNDFIALLSDPAADIRFWAAYRLAQCYSDVDLSPALSQLDQIVAFDHNLPLYYGWPVSREAIQPLEVIYCRKLGLVGPNTRYMSRPCGVWLISPASEYYTFMNQYRHWNKSGIYATDTLPPIDLNVNPDWLADKLRENWPDIALNVREPRTQAYLLDWKLIIDGHPLIGGLLRDGYGVVLTGDEPVNTFAAWYRSIIAQEYPLYLYEWADPGIELHIGITPDEIQAAYNALWENPFVHPQTNT